MKYRIDIERMTPSQLVSWFLIGCYAYYELSDPVMADSTFDFLVERLKKQWDNTDHYHKYLINESHLSATTGYDIKYPKIVIYATINYLRETRQKR